MTDGYVFKDRKDVERVSKAVNWVHDQFNEESAKAIDNNSSDRRTTAPIRPARVVCRIGNGWYKLKLMDLLPREEAAPDAMECEAGEQVDHEEFESLAEEKFIAGYSLSSLVNDTDVFVCRIYDGTPNRTSDRVRFIEYAVLSSDTGGDLTLGMVDAYLGRGWYRVNLVDLAPPELPANENIAPQDEPTHTRIVQPVAGYTEWTYSQATGEFTAGQCTGGNTGSSPTPGQQPNPQDYPGIQDGQTVTLPCVLPDGEEFGNAIPPCWAIQCAWSWNGTQWDKQAKAPGDPVTPATEPNNSPDLYVHGGLLCNPPPDPPEGTAIGTAAITFGEAADCQTATQNQVTWTWKSNPPATEYDPGAYPAHWTMGTPCGDPPDLQPPDEWDGGGCAAAVPDFDGAVDGEQTTTNCYLNGLGAYVVENLDPLSQCCMPGEEGDPDNVPRQSPVKADPGETLPIFYKEPVLAYQINKLTVTGIYGETLEGAAQPGTLVWMQTFQTGQYSNLTKSETHYAILQFQREAISVSIPRAIQCCDDGSIKITDYQHMVEGIYCGQTSEPCP